MEQQNEEVVDTQEQTQEAPANQDTQEEFDPKSRVDFNPEQQRKFNDLYKQVKMSDARNKMLADMNQKALDKIDELEKRFSQTDHAEAERILTSRLKEARESGDEDKADKIFQELIDFKVDSRLNKKQPEKPKPVDAMVS